jgi:tRNA threonylcarbamoyladenosine biosynthesis protein TsaB
VIILALDAASSACSAALLDGGHLLAHRHAAMERGQAEALIPLLAETLAEAGLDSTAADLIACTVGPGAFTGVRIGLAAARGLALATGKPFSGITTLEAVAAATPEAERQGRALLALVDARRTELFAQIFDASLTPLGEPFAALPEDMAAHLPPGPLLIAGEKAELVVAALPGRDVLISRALAQPDALWVARLALKRAEQGLPARPAQPLYLRAPDVTLAKT